VWIWYLFCEVASEMMRWLVKAQGGSKTKDSGHIDVTVEGKMALWCSLMKRHRPLSEQQGLLGRQSASISMGSPSVKQTPAQLQSEDEDTMMCPAHQWQTEDTVFCSSSRQKVSTIKGTCYMTPEHLLLQTNNVLSTRKPQLPLSCSDF
jgi:hypothetical protein